MEVYLVQHGQALSDEQSPQRPLSDEGRAAVGKVAVHLSARLSELIHPPITEIRHSGKLRARQTAEILAQALCSNVTPAAGESMGPNDDPRTIHDELTANRDQPGAIMLVGHLPHLARLAGLLLTGEAGKTPVRFTNAAVLKISPTENAWAVDWYLTPACVG